MAGEMPPTIGRFGRYLFSKLTGQSLPQAGTDIQDTIKLTPAFAVSGGPFAYYHRQRAKKLVVKIPAGTREGQQIRLSQMGGEGKHGGPAGDLYLKVKFQRSMLEKAKAFIGSHVEPMINGRLKR